jgi:AraC-like DNA-binding protein
VAEEHIPDGAHWQSAAPNQSFVDLMKQAMAPYLETGEATLEIASEIAGMSPRTLQRRLSDGGRSFSDLMGEVRFERACELLDDPHAKIIEVAIAAGYQNHAHFSRAFRRMTGMSPRAYRRDVGQAAPVALP